MYNSPVVNSPVVPSSVRHPQMSDNWTDCQVLAAHGLHIRLQSFEILADYVVWSMGFVKWFILKVLQETVLVGVSGVYL